MPQCLDGLVFVTYINRCRLLSVPLAAAANRVQRTSLVFLFGTYSLGVDKYRHKKKIKE